MRIAIIAPQKQKCGVSDYTDHLTEKLTSLVALTRVTPEEYNPRIHTADVIHIQHQYFLFGGVAPWRCTFPQLARKLSAPTVMTVHEFVDPAGSPLRRAAVRLSNRLHFDHEAIRKYIVHTERDRNRMAAAGFPADKIAIVRHGVPDPRALPSAEAAKAAFELQGKFVVTILGFISEKKGHGTAIDALNYLPNDITLVIAGGRHPDDHSSYVSTLSFAAGKSHNASRIRFTDYLSEDRMSQALAASDLIIAPYTESSGSGSLALAFSAGKPILASDIVPHTEINQDSPNALALTETDNPEALAAAISNLKNKPQSLINLASNSQTYAQNHSYQRMADETKAIYESL